MTTAGPDLRTARLVRQHAETARLLGVDFVPAFRSESPAAPAAAVEVSAPEAAVEPTFVDEAAPLREPATIAAAPAPMPTPAPMPAPPQSAKRSPRKAGAESDRDEAQHRLDELRERYEREAPHKRFITAYTNIVFGEGDPRARLMFVGEAPGADEDRTGRPFVGRAGQLLDKMITAMGLDRSQVYIANVLKVRPPNNATPTKEEAEASAPYLFEQIAIIRPEVIVTLGLPASRLLLGTDETMTRLRGRWAEFSPGGPLVAAGGGGGSGGGGGVPVMPTYHPAFLLRSYTRENRAKVWSDLQKVMDRLGLTGPANAAAPGGFGGE